LGVDVVLVQPSNDPTNIFASAQHPVDAARRVAYGEIGAIPGTLRAFLDLAWTTA